MSEESSFEKDQSMNIKELESEESPGKFDVIGDESLEDKDKLINCSDNKIAGSKQ